MKTIYDLWAKRFTEHSQINFKQIFENGNILDAGCGEGDYIKGMQQAGINCYGIDISKGNIQKTKSIIKHPEKAILGDLEETPFNSNFFNFIYIINVFEEIKIFIDGSAKPDSSEYRQTVSNILKEMYRILKKGGYYMIIDDYHWIDESLHNQKAKYIETINITTFKAKIWQKI